MIYDKYVLEWCVVGAMLTICTNVLYDMHVDLDFTTDNYARCIICNLIRDISAIHLEMPQTKSI